MRSASLARTALFSTPSSAARAPSLERLQVFWPRYLRVKGHGNLRTYATGRARDTLQEKKAYSTAIQLPIPLSGVHDINSAIQDEEETAAPSAQAQVGDRRYYDPKEYLEDYGEGIPEATVAHWQTDLDRHPADYNIREWDDWQYWVKSRGSTQRQTMNSLKGEEEEVREWQSVRTYSGQRTPWEAAYLRLAAQFDTSLDRDFREPAFLGDPRAEEWSRPFLQANPEDQRSMWLNLNGDLGSAIWGHVMLYVLHHHPERALDVLGNSILFARRTVPGAIEHILKYVTQYLSTLDGRPRQELHQQIINFLDRRMRPVYISKHDAFNAAITLLRREGGDEKIAPLYNLLSERNLPLSSWSHLHFAYHFAHSGDTAVALDALQASIETASDVNDATSNINRAASRSVCNVVLRHLVTRPDGYRVALQVVTYLIQKNARFSLPLTNALMLSAVEAGDNETCLQLYRSAVAEGLVPSSYTHEFALRAVRAGSTTEQVQAVITAALKYKGDDRMYVYNAVLRCLDSFYSHEGGPDVSVFRRLLDVYRQNFVLDPLVKLGIVANDRAGSEVTELLEPDPATIHIMLSSYLQNVTVNTEQKWQLWQMVRYYMRWDLLYARCSESPYFYATFISHLGRDKAYVGKCLTILKAMIEPSVTDGRDDEYNPDLRGKAPVAPNDIVMGTLLVSLLDHSQHKAAENLMALMKRRRIPMTKIGYGMLISAHNRKQDSERAIAAVKSMQGAGFDIDAQTITRLRFVKDQKGLTEALNAGERDILTDGANSVSAASPFDFGLTANSVTFRPLVRTSDTTHEAKSEDNSKESAERVDLRHTWGSPQETSRKSGIGGALWGALTGRKAKPAEPAAFDGLPAPVYYVSDAKGKLQHGNASSSETPAEDAEASAGMLSSLLDSRNMVAPAPYEQHGSDQASRDDHPSTQMLDRTPERPTSPISVSEPNSTPPGDTEQEGVNTGFHAMNRHDWQSPPPATFRNEWSDIPMASLKSSTDISDYVDHQHDRAPEVTEHARRDEGRDEDEDEDEWAYPNPVHGHRR